MKITLALCLSFLALYSYSMAAEPQLGSSSKKPIEAALKSPTTSSLASVTTKECNKPGGCLSNPDLGTTESLTINPQQNNSSIIFSEHNFKTDSSNEKNIKIILHAKILDENVSVLYKDKYVYIRNKETADFTVMTDIPKDKSFENLSLTVVDKMGKLKKEIFSVKYRAANSPIKIRKISRWAGSYSLGLTNMEYSEVELKYQSIAVTIKGGARYRLTDKWTLKGSSFLNLFPLSKNNDKFLRIVGLNLLAGYSLPNQGNWNFGVNGGGYYLSSFVSQNCFGFANVYGPEILLNARNNLTAKNAIDAYLKFALLSTGKGIASFKNNEVAIGTGYYFPYGQHNLSVNFDVSRMSLPLLYDNVKLNTYSLSLGVSI